jgi:hypothetical protein
MGKTAQSTFDGNLIKKLQQWGWHAQPSKEEADTDKQCNFDKYHKVRVSILTEIVALTVSRARTAR